MSILGQTGVKACRECGERARAERDRLKAENAELRDERARYEDLTRILDREWNIEVEWDGLRKIWYVGLTELGVRLRDEREAVRFAHIDTISELEDQNAKLRELCADMLAQLLNAYDPKELTEFLGRLHEFGIEVE